METDAERSAPHSRMDPIYRSALNRDVPAARTAEFASLRVGAIAVWPPVVLAPMAGVTNPPFRTLCRRFGAGLYVSEMITARAFVEGNRKTLLLASFGAEETTRSLQLYGVDPFYVGEAVRLLVGEGRVDHLDLNFGCPVRKVTSRGGGAAIPVKPRLLRSIVRSAVAAAGDIPVTIKFRMGIDEQILTYLDAGRIGEEEGCAAVGLHARTAAQLYDGEACWDAIARLKQAVKTIPVLGNGDIWEAEDALRMMRTTRCDGVICARGWRTSTAPSPSPPTPCACLAENRRAGRRSPCPRATWTTWKTTRLPASRPKPPTPAVSAPRELGRRNPHVDHRVPWTGQQGKTCGGLRGDRDRSQDRSGARPDGPRTRPVPRRVRVHPLPRGEG